MKTRMSVSVSEGCAMGRRTLVVYTRPRLPKMAEPSPWVSILPGPLPCLCIWHTHHTFHSSSITMTTTTAEDEEAISLALAQRDRVRRIRFYIPVLKLQKLIMAIDGEYPILEYLILWDPPEDRSTVSVLPEALQTPHLCHLAIDCSIPVPIRSPLLGTAAGLVNSILDYTTHSLPADCSAPMAFIDASAGDAPDLLLLPCCQPRC